jgi:hypothetical protein
MNKCVKCVFYKLTYNMSYCIKFNTFTEFARVKCGSELKHFSKKKSLVNITQYNNYTTNF